MITREGVFLLTATYEKCGPFRNPLLRNVLREKLLTREYPIIPKRADTLAEAISHEVNLYPFVHHGIEWCAYLVGFYLTFGVLIG